MFRIIQISLLTTACLLVLILSVMPLGDIAIRNGDKVVHVLFYMALTLNGLWIWTDRRWQIGLAAFFYGTGLEIVQAVLPYRWYSFDDILANGAGVLLGFLLAPVLIPLGDRVLNVCLKAIACAHQRATPLFLVGIFLAPLMIGGLSGCTPTYVPRNDEPARAGLSYQAEYRDRPQVVSVDAADLLDRPSWQINEDACVADP